jgi:hypothetical protein
MTSCVCQEAEIKVVAVHHRENPTLLCVWQWSRGEWSLIASVETRNEEVKKAVTHPVISCLIISWDSYASAGQWGQLKRCTAWPRSAYERQINPAALTGAKHNQHKQEYTAFWDITPCSPLNVNRRFGGTSTGLHGVITQNIVPFITTTVRTSNPTTP